MTWRTAIGLKPSPNDLALDLLKALKREALTGWQRDPKNDSIRNGEHVVNLANMHLEYAAAPRAGRPLLLQKYLNTIKTPPVPKLWSLAQNKIYPLLRSRYDRIVIDIANRTKQSPVPPRAGRRLIGNLDQILGYDHPSSISQVNIENLAEWGVTLEVAIDRALANLRALPAHRWHVVTQGLWQLESPEGYAESLLQNPKIFADLPARGSPLIMIPNRGILIATGSEEPNGLSALLAEARRAQLEKPWPLAGEVYRVGAGGIELFTPYGPDATEFANVQKFDIESVYAAQKTALEAHCAAIQDDVFVATYSFRTTNGDPKRLLSACAWTQGAPSLLPKTDLIAFVWDLSKDRKIALVSWQDAAAIVGHYFKPTDEDPPRIRVDEFPKPNELAEIQKHSI